MSISKKLTFKNKTVLYSTLALGVLATTIGGYGVITFARSPMLSDNAKQALESGNLDDFKKAITEESNQKLQNRLNNLTEEKFTEMQEQYKKQQAVQTAIENNDYEAFKTAVENLDKNKKGPDFSKITTQEEFDKLVADKKAMDEFKSRLTEAVKNENKDDITKILNEMKEYRENNNQPTLQATNPTCQKKN